MYEHMRTRFQAKLAGRFTQDELEEILLALDDTARFYDISEAQTALVPYEGGIPSEVKMYGIDMKLRGMKDGTLKNYGLALANFFRLIPKKVSDVDANDIRMFIHLYRKERPNLKDGSMDKVRQYISSFFGWCRRNKYIKDDPTETIDRIRFKPPHRGFYSKYELELIRSACKNSKEKAMIEFMYSTGCRIAELSNARIFDMDLREGTVHLTGKFDKERTVCLSPKAKLSIEQYLAERKDGCEFVIPNSNGEQASTNSLRVLYESILKRTGIEKKRSVPHTMRHTTATHMLRAGVPIDQVSAYLGHASVGTTQIYAETDLNDIRISHGKHVA